MDTVIRLYCRTARQLYDLTVHRDRAGRETVTDFRLAEALDEPLPEGCLSPAPEGLTLAPGLRGCAACGQRVACACLCLEKAAGCETHVGFRSQCVFCSRLAQVREDAAV